jgi:hypothetical protein
MFLDDYPKLKFSIMRKCKPPYNDLTVGKFFEDVKDFIVGKMHML